MLSSYLSFKRRWRWGLLKKDQDEDEEEDEDDDNDHDNHICPCKYNIYFNNNLKSFFINIS